ncbi:MULTISPECIES: RNA polymerase sigma factor [unclassified Sphingobacterium]|uniref:RNA polymerase sigma factor n=1 Tax=unclassified Sphingobacterium TaxID=2609468 RepID=UPI0025E66C71|nr:MULTISPECIES: sigma-70 family RNA polymerase sigma factor [unclassified Sphingobacterium]
MHILTDEELYHFVKNDDRRAYTELYNRFRAPLLDYTLRKINKSNIAEDIVQDVFVKLWINRGHIDLEGHFVGYIYRTLRNSIFDYLSHSIHVQRHLDSVEPLTDYEYNTTDFKVREESLWNIIRHLLDQYSPHAQPIVLLRMQGYKNPEIAKMLNLSEKTIRNQQSAIIKYLKLKIPNLNLK